MQSDSDKTANRLSDFDKQDLTALRHDARAALMNVARFVSNPYLPAQNKDEEIAERFLGWALPRGARRVRAVRDEKAGRRTLRKFFEKYQAWLERFENQTEVMRHETDEELTALYERIEKLEAHIEVAARNGGTAGRLAESTQDGTRQGDPA